MNEVVRGRLRSVRDALMGLSLANLCFIRAASGLFFEKDYGYYKQVPLSKQALLALTLNLILFGLVAWLVARLVRRAESRFLYWSAAVVVCGLLVIPLDYLRYYYLPNMRALDWVTSPFFFGGVLVLLPVCWLWARFVVHLLGAVLLIFVPAAFLTLGRIGYYFAKVRPQPVSQFPALFPTKSPSVEPRVVWIVFDELDQRLAFPSRPKNCPLPELDRLCAESLQATNAFPPAGGTRLSLPALTTGRYVIKAEPASRNELNITYADVSTPVGWSTQSTVFSRARELGFNTALVGWFHPYSRLLSSCLNFCTWYPAPDEQVDRGETLLHSMIAQVSAMVTPVQQRWMYIDLIKRSLDDSRYLVKDRRYGLILLHLVIPHLPGIYDPSRDAFSLTILSNFRGYFQNLQLTDKAMGILRHDMEQAGLWDCTWVIVSSDHWWREARAYDGHVGYHVPFILKAPGKNQPIIYGASLNTVITQDLILAILRKEVSTIPEVTAWLDVHEPPPSPNYNIMKDE